MVVVEQSEPAIETTDIEEAEPAGETKLEPEPASDGSGGTNNMPTELEAIKTGMSKI